MIKQLLILFLCFSTLTSLYAQNNDRDSVIIIQQQLDSTAIADEEMTDEEMIDEEEIPIDTIINIHPVNFSFDSVLIWKSKKEYAYLKNLDSLLRALQEEEDRRPSQDSQPAKLSWLESIFNASIIKMILWLLAIFFVMVVLFQLFKNNGLFKRVPANTVEEDAIIPAEDLLEQDFEKLLQQALKQGNFRLAIRYEFLKTLQLLRNKGHIEFTADKTNSKYVYEIPANMRNNFAGLILNYEYVWYGNFALTADQYTLLQKKYTSFNEKI